MLSARLNSLLSMLLIGFVLAIYVFTIPYSFSEGEDSLAYIFQSTSGSLKGLLNPNHLLFNPLNYTAYQSVRYFFPEVSFSAVATGIVILCSLVNVILCYRICVLLKFSTISIILTLCGTSFSYGYWIYSLLIDTYVLPVIFILLIIIQLIHISQEGCSPKRFYLLSVYTVLGVLSHQQEVLLLVVVPSTLLTMFYTSSISSDARDFFGCLFRYLVASAILIGLTYTLIPVVFFGASSVDDIIHWSRGVANTTVKPEFGAVSIIKGVVGIGKSIWGGYFLFHFDAFKDFVASFFHDKLLEEEIFLAERMSWNSVIISAFFLIVSICTFFSILWLAMKNWKRKLSSQEITLISFCMFFIVVYGAFDIWWEPYNIEFWIALIPVLYLLLSVCINLSEPTSAHLICVIVFSVSLFFTNLFGNMLPFTDLEKDFWYQKVKKVSKISEDDDLIIINVTQNGPVKKPYHTLLKGYYQYYAKGEVIYLSEAQLEEVYELISKNETRKIYLSQWVFGDTSQTDNKLTGWSELLNRLTQEGASIELLDQSEHQVIWIIQFPQSLKQTTDGD